MRVQYNNIIFMWVHLRDFITFKLNKPLIIITYSNMSTQELSEVCLDSWESYLPQMAWHFKLVGFSFVMFGKSVERIDIVTEN